MAQGKRTQLVSVTTDLPLTAETAFALAHKLSVFDYVVAPILQFNVSDEQRAAAADPDGLAIGATYSVRLWFFKVIPTWIHTLTIVGDGPTEDGALELYTNETSGPVRVWNHRLTFRANGESGCTYTDEIEIPRGPMGPGTKLFIAIFFRYRQWRWRRLARIIA